VANSGTKFDGGRLLARVQQRDPELGTLLTNFIDAMNRGVTAANVSTAGELPAPPPVDSISVKGVLSNNVLTAPGELLHFVHTHNSPLNRGIRYITEIDTDPNFPAPHPIYDSTSRSGFTTLPTLLDDNVTPAVYYLRVTPQYHGSAPAKPTVFGGLQGPTQIVMSGKTAATLLPSQAGGTAKPGQGGQGLGKVAIRGSVGGPKRQLTNI
jgi:hypothetical protein